MASIPQACRLLRNTQLRKIALTRGFNTSGHNAAAKNFKMPAMSPTMTEGNISSWKVKEGEKYKAGDVLLEIETDKANIDVEAQEDGIVAKIFAGNETKGIPVGKRIAVLAEPNDDLSTLKIPDEPAPKPAPAPKADDKADDKPNAAPPPSQPRPDSAAQVASSPSHGPAKKHHRPPKEPFTPSPSVMALLHRNKLTKDDLPKIPATGPRGRLLKGDVLAYLGTISKDSPATLESLIDKLAHLDLSNIKVKQTPTPAPTPEEKKPPKPTIAESDIHLEISLDNLSNFQNKVQEQMGFSPPLSAFLTQASLKASHNLPASKLPPTPDQLFYELLGKPRNPVSPQYKPQLKSVAPTPPPASTPKLDILDILSGKKPTPAVKSTPAPAVAKNVLSLKVNEKDEKRARVYLERVRGFIEAEPEKLFAAWGEGVRKKALAETGLF